MTLRTFIMLLFIFVSCNLYSKDYSLSSPDNSIEVTIKNDNYISYSVSVESKQIIAPSNISLTLENSAVLGNNSKEKRSTTRSVENILTPVVKQKNAQIEEKYNELKIFFENNFALTFRAFNNGIAYRWETSFAENITIQSEQVSFNFNAADTIYFPEEEGFQSHNERVYKRSTIGEIPVGSFCSLPALVRTKNNIHVFLSEADLYDYPGLWLKINNQHNLSGTQPGVALKDTMENDRDVPVTKYADYIANTSGTRTLPWRIMGIASNDAELITNEMVFLLSKPSQIKDPSWIKPGKVAWDWYNALNISGVDFKSGVNTETYKYYIDFASKYGIEYVILDEGWYKLGDLFSISPGIDVEEIIRYGKEKNVKIILWVIWKTLDDQLAEALDLFEKWGVVGIKVDFMQRDDQWMVSYYYRIAQEAAKRKLLVDFHGSYKPAGLHRTYPNVITREGVKGLENNKWEDLVTPEHNLTLPFIRMVAGPMDYTPGAMVNAQQENFRSVFYRPMSQGTRCHQLAMYVVFESPLQMLADNPSLYLKEPQIMEFLGPVPTVWDETKVLHAKVSDYVVIARRNRDEWYVGAMTDWTPREFELDFSFLDSGEYSIDIFQDGINADRWASDYKKVVKKVSNKDKVNIKLAPGGGWVGRISKSN